MKKKTSAEIANRVLSDLSDEIIVLGLHLKLTLNETKEIEKEGDNTYKYDGEYYYCGADDEMFSIVKDYIEDTLWAFNNNFLWGYGSLRLMNAGDCDVILNAVKDKAEDGNEAIKALVDWNNNWDELVAAAIGAEGIGHFLNSYDGTHEEVTYNEVDYIICKQ